MSLFKSRLQLWIPLPDLQMNTDLQMNSTKPVNASGNETLWRLRVRFTLLPWSSVSSSVPLLPLTLLYATSIPLPVRWTACARWCWAVLDFTGRGVVWCGGDSGGALLKTSRGHVIPPPLHRCVMGRLFWNELTIDGSRFEGQGCGFCVWAAELSHNR